MNCAAVFKAVRQCRPPHLASGAQRWLAVAGQPVLRGTRQYSAEAKDEPDQKAEKGNESGGAGSSGKADATAESSEKKVAELSERLKLKEQEVTDLTGRLRYLQADFINLQRNSARDKEQTRDYAITKFAGDLLETVDVLSMALKSVPESALKAPQPSSSSSPPDTPSPSETAQSLSSNNFFTSTPPKSAQAYLGELHNGVEMTHRLLLSTLFKYNVKPFDPTGDKFDPNKMEALYQAPVPNAEPGSVIDCQKVGYTIKDRTLRAAQVGVAADKS